MPAGRIVEALDLTEHIRPDLIAHAIDFPSNPRLQRREDALHGNVVPDVAGLAHPAGYAVVDHEPLESLNHRRKIADSHVLGHALKSSAQLGHRGIPLCSRIGLQRPQFSQTEAPRPRHSLKSRASGFAQSFEWVRP